MEKNKTDNKQVKGTSKENENQKNSRAQDKNQSYQDVVPGAKKTSQEDSRNSGSSSKGGNTERNR